MPPIVAAGGIFHSFRYELTGMRTLLLPGMDGGSALLEEFRSQLGSESETYSYPGDEPLSYAALEKRVRSHIASITGPLTLVAESFSGPIAISIASTPPDHLKRLVLVATFDRSPAPGISPSLIPDLMFRRPPPAMFIRWKMLGRSATMDDIKRVQSAIRAVDGGVLASRLRAVLGVDVREEAAAIRLPVLSLRASHDRLVKRPLALRGPNWRETTIRGPHLLLQQRPRECAEAIHQAW